MHGFISIGLIPTATTNHTAYYDVVVLSVLVLLCSVVVVVVFVFQEILQYGRSFEVEKIICSDRYQKLKVCWQRRGGLCSNRPTCALYSSLLRVSPL